MSLVLDIRPPINGDRRFPVEVKRDGERVFADTLNIDSAFERKRFLDGLAATITLDDRERSHLDQQLMYNAPLGTKPDASILCEPVLIELKDVEEATVEWIWPAWLPKNAITLIDGDPGTGKSQVTMDLTARVTTGRPMPPIDGPNGVYDPRNVVILTKEDEPGKVLKPRLRAAGANIARVSVLPAVKSGDKEQPINLRENIPQLEHVVGLKNPALVIIDPITSFTGGYDLNKDSEARELLQPVLTLANQHDTTFLIVRHLNKKEGASPLYRGGASIGIIGIARAAWIVSPDPNDRETFVLAMNKSNYAKFPRSLMYAIESVDTTSRVTWSGESDLTAGDCMGKRKDDGGKTKKCADWLRQQLARTDISSKQLQEMAEAAGFPEATYKRARKEAGVAARHDAAFDGGWVSFLTSNGSDF